MVVTCDKCKREFKMEPKEEEVKERISKVFFNCAHCNEEYISHYTSALIKIKQNKIQNIQEEYSKAMGRDFKKTEKLFKQFQAFKKEIGKDMDNLEKRMNGGN